MRILILFGTIEGQTEKIANFIQDDLTSKGHDIVMANSDSVDEIRFADVDAVILAGSVHERRHPKNFEASLIAHQKELAALRTLFLSISLNAAFPEGREEAEDYATEMKMRTGLEPDQQMLVAGAVRNARYDYFAMQVVQHVLLRDHAEEAKSGLHEFTDWEAVKRGVESFLQAC